MLEKKPNDFEIKLLVSACISQLIVLSKYLNICQYQCYEKLNIF